MPDETIIIDSAMSLAEALAQNPKSPAPKNILGSLELAVVQYRGFDEKLHEGRIVMNKSTIDAVREFFARALEMNFPIKSVTPISDTKYKWDDETSCDDGNTSGYNYRTITGDDTRLSKHATGLAFDINPAQNIYVRYDESGNETFRSPSWAVYDPDAPGTLTAGHPLVELMKKSGWKWGGDWTKESGRQDYQHFETA